MKQIIDSKRSDLSSDSLEKRSILFTTSHFEKTCSLHVDKAIHGDMFGDDDIRIEYFL